MNLLQIHQRFTSKKQSLVFINNLFTYKNTAYRLGFANRNPINCPTLHIFQMVNEMVKSRDFLKMFDSSCGESQ